MPTVQQTQDAAADPPGPRAPGRRLRVAAADGPRNDPPAAEHPGRAAAWLKLGDERKRWLDRIYRERADAARIAGAEAYARGYADGYTDGLDTAKTTLAEVVGAWRLPAEALHSQEARQAWAAPRAGDYTGGRATGWDTAGKRGGA